MTDKNITTMDFCHLSEAGAFEYATKSAPAIEEALREYDDKQRAAALTAKDELLQTVILHIKEIKETYIGMEGIVHTTASEAYQEHHLKEMYNLACDALDAIDKALEE